MAKKMQAAVAYKFGEPLILEELPIPEVSAGKILVRIKASGICHTDLHAISGDWPVKPHLPFIPGHEGAGIVVEVGAGVHSVKAGDRVGVAWLHTACGLCEFCLSGWETVCESQKNTGYSVNGCYAQYVLADPAYIAHLPAQLTYLESASILCAGLTVYKGIKETDIKPNNWLAIIGIGGLGHLAVQYAKAMGLNVIAVDIHEPQLELARLLKADIVINAAQENPVEKVKKEIGGAHGVLVTATSPEIFSQGVGMLRRRGTVALIGLPAGNFELSIVDMVLNRKTVRGSIVGSRLDLLECLEFAAQKKVAAHYTKDRLENINDILDRMKKGKIQGRIVMEF